MKTWIVVVNRSEAKIFEYSHKQNETVEFVRKIENPRGRLKAQDINADKPGVFSSLMAHGTRLVKPQSPTERVAQEFAKKISAFLEDARQRKVFDDLALIAEPQLLGRMRRMFTKELRQSVTKEMAKDLINGVTGQEVKERLWPEGRAGRLLF